MVMAQFRVDVVSGHEWNWNRQFVSGIVVRRKQVLYIWLRFLDESDSEPSLSLSLDRLENCGGEEEEK